MKRLAQFVTIMLCVLTVSGCWDRREVNDIAIVIAMAIDKEPDGMYRLSIQVPLVGGLGGPSGGGGGTSGDKSYYVDSAVGQTIRDANNKLQARMSRHIYYAHHRIVVIGEELAKEGFSKPLDIISRFPENRLTAYIVMTKGKGIDLLEAQPQFERFSGEAIRELVKTVAIPVTIKDISQMLNTPGIDAFLPIFTAVDSHPKGKSKEIAASGIATFRGDKLVATYSAEEVKALRWFQKTFEPFSTVVPMGRGQRLSVYVQKGKADILPVIKKGVVHYDVKLYLEATVIENMTTYDLSQKNVNTMIEKKLANDMTASINTIFEQTKKTRSDPVGFGIVLARHFPQEWKRNYRERWYEVLPHITYSIESRVLVSNLGQTTTNITKEAP